MRTDKPSTATSTSTVIQERPAYRAAIAAPGSARAMSTTLTSERTRSVLTQRTAGVVEVRIGLAEFPRRERSTNG